jgi:hypothetical protein
MYSSQLFAVFVKQLLQPRSRLAIAVVVASRRQVLFGVAQVIRDASTVVKATGKQLSLANHGSRPIPLHLCSSVGVLDDQLRSLTNTLPLSASVDVVLQPAAGVIYEFNVT